jgi:hypothetical protein
VKGRECYGVYEFNEILLVSKPGSQVSFQITTGVFELKTDEPFALPVAFRESQINCCEVFTAGSYSPKVVAIVVKAQCAMG